MRLLTLLNKTETVGEKTIKINKIIKYSKEIKLGLNRPIICVRSDYVLCVCVCVCDVGPCRTCGISINVYVFK